MARASVPQLKMMGHGIQGAGFFHIKLPESSGAPSGSQPLLMASLLLESGSISLEALVTELNTLMEVEDWDWGISQIDLLSFSLNSLLRTQRTHTRLRGKQRTETQSQRERRGFCDAQNLRHFQPFLLFHRLTESTGNSPRSNSCECHPTSLDRAGSKAN